MGIPTKLSDKVGARWSPSFPRQSLARRRARNIVQVHAHALNGSWECYHVWIGLGAIWGDHGRRRSLQFTTPHLSEKGVGIPTFVHFPKINLKRKLSPLPYESGECSSSGSRRPGHSHSRPWSCERAKTKLTAPIMQDSKYLMS